MTRLISIGLIVRVPDDVAAGYETLYRYLQSGLLSEVDGNIRLVRDITDEVEADVARGGP
ncbi:MAG: hypothetical protein PHW83_09880 [Bacteroidales bacterium]|nr:hypothetical protein [Bacteroidales bacterium]